MEDWAQDWIEVLWRRSGLNRPGFWSHSVVMGVHGLREALIGKNRLSKQGIRCFSPTLYISFSALETRLRLSSPLPRPALPSLHSPPHFPHPSVLIWHAKVKLPGRIGSMDPCLREGCSRVDSKKSWRSSLAPRELGLRRENKVQKASLNSMYNVNLEPKSIFDCRENPAYFKGLWVITIWVEAGIMTLHILWGLQWYIFYSFSWTSAPGKLEYLLDLGSLCFPISMFMCRLF